MKSMKALLNNPDGSFGGGSLTINSNSSNTARFLGVCVPIPPYEETYYQHSLFQHNRQESLINIQKRMYIYIYIYKFFLNTDCVSLAVAEAALTR